MTDTKPPETGRERQLRALEEHGAATQFGGRNGNRPNNSPGGAGTKEWSLKHSIRYLARQKSATAAIPMPDEPTIIQRIAANTLAKASKGDMRAVEFVGEQIDGKVHQVNINAELEDLLNKTPEELDEIERELDRALEHARGSDPAEEGQAQGPDGSQGTQQVAAGTDSHKPIV